MNVLIEKFTPPPKGYFGLNFNRRKQIEQFLKTPESLFISVDKSLIQKLSSSQAESFLNNGATLYRVSTQPFSLNLKFTGSDLLTADKETLTITFLAHVELKNEIEFVRSNLIRLDGCSTLTDDQLESVWSEAFFNSVLIETHKIEYSHWKSQLTPSILFNSINRIYTAPFIQKTVAGAQLVKIDSLTVSSPSVEQRELEKQRLKQEEYEKQQELLRQQQQKRLQQEQEKQRLELEKQRLEKNKQDQDREQFLIDHKNRWQNLTDSEKVVAGQLSALFQDQSYVHPCTIQSQTQTRLIEIDNYPAEYQVLQCGASLSFTFTAPITGFVSVLNLGTSGNISFLTPNSITGSNVQVIANQTYRFPQTFMPTLDADIFIEQSKSGLEGIYVIITPQPLISVPVSGQLTSLPELPYKKVIQFINNLKQIPKQNWAVGVQEFEVIR